MDYNFFDINPNSGLDGTAVEHEEWAMESMREEIESLSRMETLMDQETAAAAFKAACESELTIKQLACRDALDRTEDESIEIFANYGLVDEYSTEAAKDVLARGAYISSAKIKTMIASIVKYIQELITFSSTTNKGFKSLEKLAKKAKESLRKKQGSPKVTSDKFTKEIHNLDSKKLKITVDKKFLSSSLFHADLSKKDDRIALFNMIEIFLGDVGSLKIEDIYRSLYDKIKEKKDEKVEEIKDKYDELKDKEEFEKGSLLAKVIENLGIVEDLSKTFSKDNNIKNLEKIKKSISKLSNESNLKKMYDFKTGKKSIGGLGTGTNLTDVKIYFQNALQVITSELSITKLLYKNSLKLFDDVLTEAKAVEAMLA